MKLQTATATAIDPARQPASQCNFYRAPSVSAKITESETWQTSDGISEYSRMRSTATMFVSSSLLIGMSQFNIWVTWTRKQIKQMCMPCACDTLQYFWCCWLDDANWCWNIRSNEHCGIFFPCRVRTENFSCLATIGTAVIFFSGYQLIQWYNAILLHQGFSKKTHWETDLQSFNIFHISTNFPFLRELLPRVKK